MHALDHAVHQQAAAKCYRHAQPGADQLADQAHAAQPTQGRLPKDAAGNATPHATQAMQRPHAQHVVDLPARLGSDEAPYEQATSDHARDQRAHRMHQVGTGADCHQPGQRTVVQKTGIVTANYQGSHGAADHGHQRIDGHQTTDAIEGLRAHHVKAEPAHDQNPRAQRQERNARRRKRHQAPFTITPIARAQQQHRRQRQPAAHGVNNHGTGKVVEAGAKGCEQPCLQAKVAVPYQAFEERVDKRHDQRGGTQLRGKLRTLGNPAGNNCRNRRGKRQQEEKLHQAVAMIGADHRGRLQEAHPVGDPIAYKEIGQR